MAAMLMRFFVAVWLAAFIFFSLLYLMSGRGAGNKPGGTVVPQADQGRKDTNG
jgi:hypothetical protein